MLAVSDVPLNNLVANAIKCPMSCMLSSVQADDMVTDQRCIHGIASKLATAWNIVDVGGDVANEKC